MRDYLAPLPALQLFRPGHGQSTPNFCEVTPSVCSTCTFRWTPARFGLPKPTKMDSAARLGQDPLCFPSLFRALPTRRPPDPGVPTAHACAAGWRPSGDTAALNTIRRCIDDA